MGIFGKYKPANYPVGIVQNGTLENEKWVTGTLETITDIVKKEGIFAWLAREAKRWYKEVNENDGQTALKS